MSDRSDAQTLACVRELLSLWETQIEALMDTAHRMEDQKHALPLEALVEVLQARADELREVLDGTPAQHH